MQYHPNLFLYHGIVADCYKSIFVKLTSRAAPRKSWGVHPLVMTVNYLTTLTENWEVQRSGEKIGLSFSFSLKG